MIFVRGIMGNVKLNPAIKLWGGLLLMLLGASFTLFVNFANDQEDVIACEKQGGVWLAGVPVRIGFARFLGGRCEMQEEAYNW